MGHSQRHGAVRAAPPTRVVAGAWAGLALLAAAVAGAADRPASVGDGAAELGRIDSLRIAYRPVEALERIAITLPDARATGDTTLVLELLLRQGSLLASTGRARSAEPPLREALTLAVGGRDSLALATALRWLGVAVEQQERPDEALALYARLLDVARATGDERHQGWALVGLAWGDLMAGRHGVAIERYRRAIAHFVRAPTDEGLAWAENALGTALQRGGEYTAALDAYERAAHIAERDGNAMIQSLALNNRGTLSYALGDPGVALERFQRARAIQRRIGNLRGIFPPAVNIAICETDLGRERDAMAGLDSLFAACRDQGYRDLMGMVLNQQAALAMRSARHHAAATRYRQSLALGAALPIKSEVEAHLGLAAALTALDSAETALAVVDQVLETLPADGLPDQRLLALERRGLLHARLDRPRAAIADLAHADREAVRLGLERLRPRLLAEIARCHLTLGESAPALGFLRQAAGLWEAERSVPLDPEWREQRGAAGTLIYSGLATAILAAHPGATAEAFDALQAFKARTLLERLSGPGGSGGPGASGGLGGADVAWSPPAPEPAGSREAGDVAIGPGTGPGTSPEPPGPTAMAPTTGRALQESCLRDGELLLDVYLGLDASLLFAVTRDSLRVVRLPSEATLERRLRDVYALLAAPPGDRAARGTGAVQGAGDATADLELARHALLGIRRQLFGGVEDLIARSRLVILAPDGCVNLLPECALRERDGEPTWTRVPSATLLVALRRAAARRVTGQDAAAARVLALAGGPRRGPGRRGDGATTRRLLGTPQAPLLPGAERETQLLARRYRGVTLEPRATTEHRRVRSSAAARLFAPYDVVHLAGHTTIDDQHPWQSAIHLGAAGECVGLTTLEADRIAGSRLGARLAVLSGCASATGRVLSGEGVLGLGSAFLSAGVPAVVATLWPVDDRTTVRLMETFYAGLATGRPVYQALTAAQDVVRLDPATAAPFYWAGFVVIGDGTVAIVLAPRSGLRRAAPALLAAALALIALGGGRRLRRRRRPRTWTRDRAPT